MRIRLAIPDNIITPSILDSVLEATTKANEALLAGGQAPLIQDAIRDGLRWRPENFGDGEHFDLSSEAAVRGWGDCDDLAPWLAGQLRLQGDPGAHAFTRKSGPGRYHALVRTGAGEVIDPSLWAGMKRKGMPPSVTGPIACVGEGALAVMPHPLLNAYLARMDLPYGARHLAGYALAATPEVAARRAASAASVVGEAAGIIGAEDVDAIEYMLTGLCEDIDGDRGAEVGSIFDSIASLATAVAPVASLIPGVGPVAAAALPIAGSLLSNLTGGGKKAPPPPPPPSAYGVPNQSGVPVVQPGGPPMGTGVATGTQTFPTLPVPGGMQSFPMPGGGHVAYNPNTPGPIIVRFLAMMMGGDDFDIRWGDTVTYEQDYTPFTANDELYIDNISGKDIVNIPSRGLPRVYLATWFFTSDPVGECYLDELYIDFYLGLGSTNITRRVPLLGRTDAPQELKLPAQTVRARFTGRALAQGNPLGLAQSLRVTVGLIVAPYVPLSTDERRATYGR